jgi:allantoate deiminase
MGVGSGNPRNDQGGARGDHRVSASAERIRSDIDTIARFSSSSPGTGRLTFTPHYWAAVDFVAGQLAEMGYERRTTVHGNTRFRLRGADWSVPAVSVGSHLDAVPDGGRFDGVAGVVAGVEIARLLAEGDYKTGRPYEVIVFAEEEGARFGSVLTGSKAMVGEISASALAEMRDANGVGYLEALGPTSEEAAGGLLGVVGRGDIAAHFELHIEQSLVLESARVPVGIVQAITGIRQYSVSYTGTANHAGATPMRLRTDSLAAAAEAILSVEEAATASGTTVGTVGMVANDPNAANVIPGRTVFSVDLRDIDAGVLALVGAEVLSRIRHIADRRHVRADVVATAASDAVVLSHRLRQTLMDAAARLGIEYLEMPSGAAHDTQEIARVADAAMVFVPSIGGRSHCPEEDTPCGTIALATDIIFEAVLQECGGGV